MDRTPLTRDCVGMFELSIGLFCALIGVLLLVAPQEFESARYAALQAHSVWWGSALLVAGIGLLACASLEAGWLLTAAANELTAGILLALALGFASTGAVTGTVVYGLLGLGAVVAPVLLLPRWAARLQGDLLALVLSASAIVLGVVFAAQSNPLQLALFPAGRAVNVGVGALFLCGGLALLAVQLRPVSAVPLWIAHAVLGVVYCGFAVVSALHNHAWTGVAYFGGFGLTLLALPWLAPRLTRIETTSLRTRVALTLVALATVPLVIAVSADAARADGVIVQQALVDQEVRATTQSQDVVAFDQQYRAALVSIASKLNPSTTPLDTQRTALKGLVATGVYDFGTFDAAGQPIVRSDDQPPTPLPQPLLEAIRRSGAASEWIGTQPQSNKPALIFAAAVPGGGGFIDAEIDSALLDESLARLDPDGRTGSRVFLVDATGAVIAHPDAALTAARADLSQYPSVKAALRAKAPGTLQYRTAAGSQIAGYARVSGLGWNVVVERPLALVLAGTRAERDVTFLILLLTATVAAALGIVMAHRLTAPLRGLEVAIDQLALGESHPPLPQTRISELARLAEHFGRLDDRLALRTAERERALLELRESEAGSRLIVETALDGVIIIAGDGRISSWNAQAEAIFGWAPHEALGERVVDLIVPRRYRVGPLHGLQHFLTTDEGPLLNGRIETTALHRDGHEFPVELSIAVIERDGGRTFSAFVRDITARKQAEATRSSLAAIVESSDDAILGLALDGRISSWNRGAERLYGYSAAEMIGGLGTEIIAPESRAQAAWLFSRVQNGERLEHHEIAHQTKAGRRLVVSLTMSPLHAADGALAGAAMIARDMSERIRTENEVRTLNAELDQRVQQRTAQLEAANRELEAFSYSVSHDLRAPLRALEGFSRILIEDFATQLPDEAQHYLQRVRGGAVRMGDLVDDLLAFSRLGRQGLHLQAVSPGAIVQQALAELEPEIGGRDVRIDVAALPDCLADPALLKQVYINLLTNALKFSRTRAPAVITIGSTEQPRDGAGQDHCYYVRDNGVGFDMAYVAKLFGVFQRLHPNSEYEGTGVGLAIVQRIVERHGGRVWAEGEIGVGATVTFTVPAVGTRDAE